VFPVDQKRIENIYLDASRISSGACLRVFGFFWGSENPDPFDFAALKQSAGF
jgi:hypothetical protein